jgi:hypothetical protein
MKLVLSEKIKVGSRLPCTLNPPPYYKSGSPNMTLVKYPSFFKFFALIVNDASSPLGITLSVKIEVALTHAIASTISNTFILFNHNY